MSTSHTRRVITAATLAVGATGAATIVAISSTGATPVTPPAPGPTSHQPWTPNDCIGANGGDFNACNVGNSGRGDLPYRPVATPNGAADVRLPQHLVRVQ